MQPFESLETSNATYENAALLQQAGIPIAIMTGYEAYVPKSRVLLFEAAIAAANGLGMESALRAITLSPAKILGIDDGLVRSAKARTRTQWCSMAIPSSTPATCSRCWSRERSPTISTRKAHHSAFKENTCLQLLPRAMLCMPECSA